MADLRIQIIANVKQFNAAMGRARKSMSTAVAGMQKRWGRIAPTLKRGAIAVAGIGIAAVKMAADFQKGVAEITTLMGDVAPKAVKQMSDEIKTLAMESGQALNKLTKARYDIVSAGFSSMADSIKVLNIATKAAVGGVTDVATAADILTSALNSYQLSAGDAENVSNILFTTVRLGKTTLNELSGSLGVVLPIANAAKLSLEGVGAAMATLTAGGLNTAIATTALRGAINALVAPTDQARDAMKEAGITVKRFDDGTFDLVRTIEQFKGLDPEAIKRYIPDVRAGTAVLSMASNMEKLRNNVKDFKNTAGAADEAYKKMADTFSVKVNQVLQTFKVILIDIGEALLPDLTKAMDAFQENLSANVSTIVTTAVRGLGTVLEKIGIVASYIESHKMMAEFGLVGWALFGKKGLVLGALAGAIFDPLIKKLKEASKEAYENKEAWETLTKYFPAATKYIYGPLAGVKTATDEFTDATKKSGEQIDTFGAKLAAFGQHLQEYKMEMGKAAETAEMPAAPGAPAAPEIFDTEIIESQLEIFKETMGEMDMAVLSFTLQGAEYYQAMVDQWAEKNQEWLTGMQVVTNQIGNIYDSFLNLKKAKLSKSMNAEIRAVEDREKRGLITAEDAAAQLELIREDYRKKEEAAAKAMKPIKVAQAISGAALVVINALRTKPFIPLGIAAGIMAAAAGAAQVATVMAQPYEMGGLVKNIQFPIQHFGIRDTVPAMLTPGEAVVSRPVVQKYGEREIERFAKRGDISGLSKGTIINFNISSMDTKGVREYLEGEGREALFEAMNKIDRFRERI